MDDNELLSLVEEATDVMDLMEIYDLDADSRDAMSPLSICSTTSFDLVEIGEAGMDETLESALFHAVEQIDAEMEACDGEDHPWHQLTTQSESDIMQLASFLENDHADISKGPIQPAVLIEAERCSVVAPPSPYATDRHAYNVSSMPTTQVVSATSHAQELLRRERAFLEAQCDFLHFKTRIFGVTHASDKSTDETYRRQALLEKQQLEEATQLRKMMSEYLMQHERSCRELETLISQSPLNNYRLVLMTPMESYIHLGKDYAERKSTLLSIKSSKIASTVQFIEHQTRNLDPERDFMYLDTFEKFGKLYTVDISVSMLKQTTPNEVARAIIKMRRFGSSLVEPSIYHEIFTFEEDSLLDSLLNARDVKRVHLRKKDINGLRSVVQESNTIFYSKTFHDMTVLVCDYVDKDDLHPYRTHGRIRQDMTMGIVLVPYVSPDGVQSVIMKQFAFIKHHIQHIPATPELNQAIFRDSILLGQSIRHCMSQHQYYMPGKTNPQIVRLDI